MSLPPLTAAALPFAMFNQSCFDLPDELRLMMARQLYSGKLSLRQAVSAGYTSPDNVDAWVDFWHERDIPCELRELLDLSSAEYAEWMRDPSKLKTFYNDDLSASVQPAKTFDADDYIPISHWGRDHWTTLAYIETVMVDMGGFQVGSDARMKSNRRNYRVMARDCPKPLRATNQAASLALVMEPHHATKLNDGQQVPNHDDWACVQDMGAEGLFAEGIDNIEPGVVLKFSEKGNRVANALREFRRGGGKMADFRWPDVSAVATDAPTSSAV